MTRRILAFVRLPPRAAALALTFVVGVVPIASVVADQPAPAPAPPRPVPNTQPPKKEAEAKPLFQLFPSDSLEVTTIGGKGALPFRLRILSAKAPPLTSLTVTAPVGGGRALPDGAATATSERIETVGTEHFHVLTLAIDAPGAMTAGTAYKGQILVPGGPHLPFTATERGGSDIESLTDKVALVLGLYQSPSVRVPLRNKGTTPAAISGLSTSLTDAPSGRLAQSVVTTMPAAIPPGGVSELDLTVPWPALAGVYAGSLAITAGAQRITVPFTVTTRGPTLGALPLLPFVLFIVVFGIGAGLSYGLEGWFGEGGGLVKAETVGALARAETALTVQAGAIRAHAAAQPTLTALPAIAAQLDRSAVAAADSRLERPGGLPHDEALPVAKAAQSAGQLLTSLLNLELPGLTSHPTALAALNAGLLLLKFPTDQTGLTAFDTEARKAFADARTKIVLTPGSLSAASTAPGSRIVDPVEAVDATRKAIARMATLQRFVIILVALLTAYQTFYAPNAAFGRGLDYLAVFIWSLGMTQAGTQVLSRARAKTT